MKLHKLEPLGARPSQPPQGVVTAIVKVREANYRPHVVSVRSELGPFMFTASLPAEALEFLELDPKVESVALSRELPLQKLPNV